MDTNNSPKWKSVFDDRNTSEDDCKGDIEYELEEDNCFGNLKSPEGQNVIDTSNVSRLIWPTQRLKNQAELLFLTINAIESEGRKNTRKCVAESVHLFSPGSLCCLSNNFIYSILLGH
jgi:hypothetical protein